MPDSPSQHEEQPDTHNPSEDTIHLHSVLEVDPQRTVRSLSEKQQDNVLQYFEDQTLHIQRRFVSRLSPPNGYENMAELIHDLNKLIGVIWYSIVSSEPKNDNSPSPQPEPSGEVQKKSMKLFGQNHHLLAIADNVIDYIEGYLEEPDAEGTLNLVARLDGIFSVLLDSPGVLTRTEMIRLESIAERTRIAVTVSLEKTDGFDTRIGKVYEGVLDRIT